MSSASSAIWSGFGIAFWQTLLGMKRPRHVILQFIMREQQPDWKSRLKYQVMKLVFSSVHRVVVSSKGELAYYREAFRWKPEKLIFVPLHGAPEHAYRPVPESEDYIVSAGRSFRDYQTLVDALQDLPIRAIIVGGAGAKQRYACTHTLQVLENIPLDELDALILKAKAVVVPLEDRQISIGQSVILQAMAYGKAVIATRTPGTVDYIRHLETGILVPPHDIPAMKAALRMLEDAATRNRIGQAARAQIRQHHLPSHYADRLSEALSR
ncbi:MAG: glycosyltransferase family 4 protein [Gammaproteobacteria bacterium]